MNALLPPRRSFHLRLAALVLAMPASTYAQNSFPSPTPSPDPLAGMAVQVLERQQVTLGTHTITYNRIAPPVFPATASVAVPALTTKPQTRPATQLVRRSVNTPTEQNPSSTQAAAINTQTVEKIFSVSATVYDHQITELCWPGSSSGEAGLEVFVNFDFSYLSPMRIIEANGTTYELVLGLGCEPSDSLIQAGGQPLDLSAFPAGSSSYYVMAGNTAEHLDDLAALTAFCAYYDANRSQLIATYEQQQAAQIAQRQWVQAHPVVQPNTVINFWPVRSNIYPTGSH